MTTLFGKNINGILIQIEAIQIEDTLQKEFSGQKILHPYKLIEVSSETPHIMKYDEKITPETEALLKSTTRFDVKHDGSCGALVWNEKNSEYVPYARYDIKRGKDGLFKKPGDNWIQCEEMPTNPAATHWPHFVPVSSDPKMYKWYLHAFEKSKESIKKLRPETNGKLITVEFMGPHFNQKKSDYLEDDTIVIHGSLRMNIPEELRTYEGFKEIMEKCPIEGLVAYPTGGEPMKIRGELFGVEWKNADIMEKGSFASQMLMNGLEHVSIVEKNLFASQMFMKDWSSCVKLS